MSTDDTIDWAWPPDRLGHGRCHGATWQRHPNFIFIVKGIVHEFVYNTTCYILNLCLMTKSKIASKKLQNNLSA